MVLLLLQILANQPPLRLLRPSSAIQAIETIMQVSEDFGFPLRLFPAEQASPSAAENTILATRSLGGSFAWGLITICTLGSFHPWPALKSEPYQGMRLPHRWVYEAAGPCQVACTYKQLGSRIAILTPSPLKQVY